VTNSKQLADLVAHSIQSVTTFTMQTQLRQRQKSTR